MKLDLPYLASAFLFDVVIDGFKLAGWDRLIKPWFDVWLPGDTIEQYVSEVIPSLTPADWSPTGFNLLIPHRRAPFTRPFFRVPQSNDGLVFLFDILNDSVVPLPILGFTSRMLARNRRLFDRARQLGGLRYPIGSVAFGQGDWITHYGSTWNVFAQRKQNYDPDNILTPGPGIF